MQQVATMEKDWRAAWAGGESPFGVSWGKFMMWIFLLSDAFTFGGLLVAYGALRLTHLSTWPKPAAVFTSFPLIEAEIPLLFVGLMTFILICSSGTMALAVANAHEGRKGRTLLFLLLTALGGLVFLGCQAYEWGHLIHKGASLKANPWGHPLFGACFFVITGFHGAHVSSGVLYLLAIASRVAMGIYERRGSYEGVEIAGLYWHFVDLVWVFIFTFFYLL